MGDRAQLPSIGDCDSHLQCVPLALDRAPSASGLSSGTLIPRSLRELDMPAFRSRLHQNHGGAVSVRRGLEGIWRINLEAIALIQALGYDFHSLG